MFWEFYTVMFFPSQSKYHAALTIFLQFGTGWRGVRAKFKDHANHSCKSREQHPLILPLM